MDNGILLIGLSMFFIGIFMGTLEFLGRPNGSFYNKWDIVAVVGLTSALVVLGKFHFILGVI